MTKLFVTLFLLGENITFVQLIYEFLVFQVLINAIKVISFIFFSPHLTKNSGALLIIQASADILIGDMPDRSDRFQVSITF